MDLCDGRQAVLGASERAFGYNGNSIRDFVESTQFLLFDYSL